MVNEMTADDLSHRANALTPFDSLLLTASPAAERADVATNDVIAATRGATSRANNPKPNVYTRVEGARAI
jgi:hypothetical protein